MENAQEIIEQLYGLEEHKTIRHIWELDTINEIHVLNYNQLKQHLQHLPNLMSSTPGNTFNTSIYAKIEKTKYESELSQYLNNYLSAAFSVIEHTRKHFDKYNNDSRLPEYSKKIDEYFTSNLLHNFMKGFRNYVLHYAVPQLSIIKHVTPTNQIATNNEWVTKHYSTINLKALAECSFDWTANAKTYLKQRKSDEIELLSLLEEYFNHFVKFQEWYKNKQKEMFSKEISIIEQTENKLISLNFQDLMDYIKSGNGITFQDVEHELLLCLPYDYQKEVLMIQNLDERLSLMLNKIKKRINVPHQDIMMLRLMFSQNV